MTTPPVPGFTAPNPRTWAPDDIHTAARWRADMTNTGYLFAGGARPQLLSVNAQNQALVNGSNALAFIGNAVPLNTWNVPVFGSVSANNPFYQIPMAGWYLLQGDVTVNLAGTPGNFKYGMGFQYVSNGGGAISTDGGSLPACTSASFLTGFAGMDLIQFNTFAETDDTAALYGFTNNSSPGTFQSAEFMVEWVGLPTSGSGLTGYSGPFGAVVSSPQAAALPGSGQGTYLQLQAAAAATSIDVFDPTGMVVGGTLGLDYINGQLNTIEAETVTITSVAGQTIGVSATAFPHAAGAPVAVPLSAAFMNQQLRDVVRYLAYPAMVRAVTTTTQSLASQVFPAGTQITHLSAGSIDNFGGFASNTYTAQVAGVYLVYGQVYFAGATSSFDFAAGVAVNGGTIQWGTRARSATTSARTFCATYRQHLRLNAGDTVQLFGTQDSGGAMNTAASGSAFSKLILLWRSF